MINYVDDLLKSFRNQKQPENPEKIIFKELTGYDVYNPTAPFTIDDKTYMIGRVERRDSELSEAVFFVKQDDGSYKPDSNLPRYALQDPFVSFVHDKIVIGGTEVFQHPNDAKKLLWRAKFYAGTTLSDLSELTVGPDGMKDIRIVELMDHHIGLFTRPQGKKGGRGKIGFTMISKLEELNQSVIEDAPLFNQFKDEEWGGCNEPILLANGKIGVLGHIAKFTTGDVRHYYPMVFCVDPKTKEPYGMKIIAERANFLPGPAKRDDLVDVLFSAGIIRHKNGKATLYTGVSDAEVQKIEIDDPFLEFES